MTLTIFIHGGANRFKTAVSKVEAKCEMLADGKYPLFVGWKSGLPINYFNHLFLLRRGENSPARGLISSPFVLLEDVLRSIARLPASTYRVLFDSNPISDVFFNEYKEKKIESDRMADELRGYGFKIPPNDSNDTGTSEEWIKKWGTVWNPVKLVTAPVIDIAGTGAWNSMLRRADLVLQKRPLC